MRRSVVLTLLLAAAVLGVPVGPEARKGPTLPTISEDLQRALASGEPVRVIVQASETSLHSLLGRGPHRLRRRLAGAAALEVRPGDLQELSRDPSVQHISGDLPVMSHMAITNKVTAADRVWKSSSGLLGLLSTTGSNGSGIAVAVVDSGIAKHSALDDRVIARVTFVSTEPGVTGDPFGHGTHVAGIIAGNTSAASRVTSEYGGGSAPGTQLVDVRVLGKDGRGFTSDVIAGIDWVVANRTRYGIRVINLSLGHPVTEPSATDPLCRAVARAVQAGLVVVTSAGNYGQTADGRPVLGGISSPGNSPFAVTVGAISTNGSLERSDDRVAPYSSRGPTRFDFGVKPDVVAPGSRIVSLEAQHSYLGGTYTFWRVAGSGKNAYLRMSGTSMAAAVVSGGVALLLDENPKLTPAQVKLAIQMGATFMPDDGLTGAGAGSVQFESSVRLVRNGLVYSLLGSLERLLGMSSGAAFRDAGTLIDRLYDRSGLRLLGLLEAGLLWQTAGSADWGVLHLLGLDNVLAHVPANQLVWGEVAGWTDSYYIAWGTSIQSPSGEYIAWGTSSTESEYIAWGTHAPPE